MLQERFIKIVQTLQLKTGTIARYANTDRTTISRYKSGSRKPSATPNTIQKLRDGLLGAAKEEEKLPLLKNLLEIPLAKNEEEISKTLYLYLAERVQIDKDDAGAASENFHKEKDVFAERLDASMNLAMLSNIRLSRMLNVDASLVSRFRSGSRTPRTNPLIMNKISTILFDRILALGKQEELAALTGMMREELSLESFASWLFQTSSGTLKKAEIAKKILFSLDSFSNTTAKLNIDPKQILRPEVLQDQRTTYQGYEGLRSACVRLLTDAIVSDARDLWLYSDFDIAWMSEDKNFWMQWSALMGMCVQKKIHIHIVHQLNRDMDQMLTAIMGWLPLYMSGMIDSYFMAEPTNIAFSHALFICPGVGTIEGCNVSGREALGQFRYHKDKDELAFLQESFDVFLENARPLVKVYETLPEAVKNAPLVIAPEEMTLSMYESEPQAKVISNNDFKNVRISIGDTYVGVTRLLGKNITFLITHPHMVEAFKIYAKILSE